VARVSCSFISTLTFEGWANVSPCHHCFPDTRESRFLGFRKHLRACGNQLKPATEGMRLPGTAFPIPSNCHPGPCGLKVHHEIRDPKALCASKNGASKAHSLGALLNSDSATRRSVESSPKDTQRATSAGSTGSPGLTAALRLPIDRDFAALVLVKPGDDIEENLHNPTDPPSVAAQDFATSKIVSA
jgi:hypothetical protein